MSFDPIIETGTYTGNAGTQSISIGWQPAVVLIASGKTTNPAKDQSFSYKTDTMGGDDFVSYDTEVRLVTVDGITLTSDGFDIGLEAKINNNTEPFFWIAFRAGPQIDTGTYTGNGVGGRQITTGRQPAFVVVLQTSGTESVSTKFGNVSGPATHQFQTINHFIEGINILSDGFDLQVGLSPPIDFLIRVNIDTETYHWFAFYESSGSTRNFELSTYTGDGSDPQTVVLGRQPKMVMVFGRTLTSVKEMAFVTPEFPSGRTSYFASSHIIDDPDIQALVVATGFEVNVDLNANTTVYPFIAGYF